MNRILSAFLVSTSLAFAPLIAHAGDTPDATINISAKRGALGVGYTQGHGTLHFNGSNYAVLVEGLSVGELGAVTITASGEVYNLVRVDDLDGNYVAVSAGAALGGGMEGTAMRNQKGVVIRLHETTEGADVNLSINGFAVKVER